MARSGSEIEVSGDDEQIAGMSKSKQNH